MNYFLVEPTFLVVLLQVVAFTLYIPFSYLAYRWVRAPLKREYILLQLSQLGIPQTKEFIDAITDEYKFKHFVWPLT